MKSMNNLKFINMVSYYEILRLSINSLDYFALFRLCLRINGGLITSLSEVAAYHNLYRADHLPAVG